MNSKFYLIAISLVLVFGVMFSCGDGISKSGRVRLLTTAQKEHSKRSTIPEPNTFRRDRQPKKTVKIDDVVTPEQKELIRKDLINNSISPAKGDKIQVEGLISKEVTELLIDLNIKSSSQVDQILALQKYVFKHWHYIYDPATSSDTWRSAEATLSLKYKGEYSGDCDDFAILMASFARQIGLKSQMVAAFHEDSGHAFAEFSIPSRDYNNSLLESRDIRKYNDDYWVSLDWFEGKDHNKYNENVTVFDEI